MRAVIFLTLALLAGVVPSGKAADGGASGESSIPFKRTDDTAGAGSAWRVVLSFGVVVALGVGAAYGIRRYIPASVGRTLGSSASIEVLEVRRVTPRLTLYLVHVDGERILLTQSGDRVTSLRLNPTAETPSTGHGS